MMNEATMNALKARVRELHSGEMTRTMDRDFAKTHLQLCESNIVACLAEVEAIEETLRANGIPSELVRFPQNYPGEFPEHPTLTEAQELSAHQITLKGEVPLLCLNGNVNCVCLAIKEAGYPPIFRNFAPCRSFYVDLHTHHDDRSLMYFEEDPPE